MITMDDDKETFERELEIESCDASLTLYQKKVGDVSCVVWDAALVLAKYFDFNCRKNNWLKGKKLLELGAGVGCAGLTAACFSADVVLTDLQSVLPILEKNIQANEAVWKKFDGSAKARVLEWGRQADFDFEPEIILLTDCVYYDESIEPLLDTLESLLKSDKVFAILSQEERDTPKQVVIWKQFLTELNRRFKVDKIPLTEQHPTYSSSDIHLMKIFKL